MIASLIDDVIERGTEAGAGLTMVERRAAYCAAYPKFAASHGSIIQEQGRHVWCATWLIGNDYRNKTNFYGAYPRGYLDRIAAAFPDSIGRPESVLHAFSGSLPPGPYARCDMRQDAEFPCRVEELPEVADGRMWTLVFADPPYSAPDAEKYGTPMVNRGRALRALATVTALGGHVVWLDTTWPMHRKDQWRTVGRITVVRSTNHRVRMATIFERQAMADAGPKAVDESALDSKAAPPEGSGIKGAATQLSLLDGVLRGRGREGLLSVVVSRSRGRFVLSRT
jgi:hypothetical protein